MDMNKIMDLLGLGDDKETDLEAAMQGQILPDTRPASPPPAGAPLSASGDPSSTEAAPPELPPGSQLIAAGRCPRCGDRILTQREQPCAWCNLPCTPSKDGFHLVHVALGAFQERHCFCSDDCFEAFRRMYPARVHRDCYERECRDCTFCIKRFNDESDGFPALDQSSGEGDSASTTKA